MRAKLTAFSTPWDAPLVPDLPFEYRDVQILTSFYRSDPRRIRQLVPEPLEPLGDLVAIHIYDMRDTDWFGPYKESAVQIPVRMPDTDERGAYAPYLFLDSDGALAVGREVYGHPKKLGNPRIEARGDLIVGEIERNGITFVTTTTPYKQTRATADDLWDYFDFRTNINYKVIPGADGENAIRQLTARRLENVTLTECWRAQGTVELRPNAQAPVSGLPVLEALDAFYWNCSFQLGPARIIHHYA